VDGRTDGRTNLVGVPYEAFRISHASVYTNRLLLLLCLDYVTLSQLKYDLAAGLTLILPYGPVSSDRFIVCSFIRFRSSSSSSSWEEYARPS
jgi:hypothetical protein